MRSVSQVEALRAGSLFWHNGKKYVKVTSKWQTPVFTECGTKFVKGTIVEHNERIHRKRTWVPSANNIAGAIRDGSLRFCCNTGCARCNYTRWQGEVYPENWGDYYSTGTYARIKRISLMTVHRLAKKNKIRFFYMKGSKYKYVVL